MELKVKPGKYIVAVSGGVDSVVLLDILSKKQGLDLIVAHFDHGIRDDSAKDRTFVQGLAGNCGLRFEYEQASLGRQASEAVAREARYRFLAKIKDKYEAAAIITAHHQDDLLETMIINLIRGTGRRGLTSLQSRPGLIRPLLDMPKSDILEYALKNQLKWHEDSTNKDTKYLRNKIRLNIMPNLSDEQREKLLAINKRLATINPEIDNILNNLIESDGSIYRHTFIVLSHKICKELTAHWLNKSGVTGFNAKKIEQIVVAIKTLQKGKLITVNKNTQIKVGKQYAKLFVLE